MVVSEIDEHVEPAESALKEAALDLLRAYRDVLHLSPREELMIGGSLTSSIKATLERVRERAAELRPEL